HQHRERDEGNDCDREQRDGDCRGAEREGENGGRWRETGDSERDDRFAALPSANDPALWLDYAHLAAARAAGSRSRIQIGTQDSMRSSTAARFRWYQTAVAMMASPSKVKTKGRIIECSKTRQARWTRYAFTPIAPKTRNTRRRSRPLSTMNPRFIA